MYTNYLPEGSIPKYEKDDIYYRTTDMKYMRKKDIFMKKEYHRIKKVSPTGSVTYKYIEVEKDNVKSQEQKVTELQKKIAELQNKNSKLQEQLDYIQHNEECNKYMELMRDGGP